MYIFCSTSYEIEHPILFWYSKQRFYYFETYSVQFLRNYPCDTKPLKFSIQIFYYLLLWWLLLFVKTYNNNGTNKPNANITIVHCRIFKKKYMIYYKESSGFGTKDEANMCLIFIFILLMQTHTHTHTRINIFGDKIGSRNEV